MLKNLSKLIAFLRAALKALPAILDAVQKAEAIYEAKTGEEKKRLALEMLSHLPVPAGWCEEDWHDLLNGLVDAAVAVLHWRGVFKHAPDHPCSEGGEG